MTETAAQPFAVTMNGPHWLSMEIALERVAAEALTWFTQADKLRQWWGPQEIEIDPVPGGAYIVSWPKMGWTMRGAPGRGCGPGLPSKAGRTSCRS